MLTGTAIGRQPPAIYTRASRLASIDNPAVKRWRVVKYAAEVALGQPERQSLHMNPVHFAAGSTLADLLGESRLYVVVEPTHCRLQTSACGSDVTVSFWRKVKEMSAIAVG